MALLKEDLKYMGHALRNEKTNLMATALTGNLEVQRKKEDQKF